MKLRSSTLVQLRSMAVAAWRGCPAAPANALAQAKEQFFPCWSYRTGPMRPTACHGPTAMWTTSSWSTPRGGINGVKITFEECETGYATDARRGVLRAPEGQDGGAHCVPAAVHRHHLRADRKGTRRQDPADHRGLWPQRERRTARCSSGTSRSPAPTGLAADIHDASTSAKKEGGLDKLKGKKIALVYHDSPFGKEPIPSAAGARSDARL